jgi:hypothetical protein
VAVVRAVADASRCAALDATGNALAQASYANSRRGAMGRQLLLAQKDARNDCHAIFAPIVLTPGRDHDRVEKIATDLIAEHQVANLGVGHGARELYLDRQHAAVVALRWTSCSPPLVRKCRTETSAACE